MGELMTEKGGPMPLTGELSVLMGECSCPGEPSGAPRPGPREGCSEGAAMELRPVGELSDEELTWVEKSAREGPGGRSGTRADGQGPTRTARDPGAAEAPEAVGQGHQPRARSQAPPSSWPTEERSQGHTPGQARVPGTPLQGTSPTGPQCGGSGWFGGAGWAAGRCRKSRPTAAGRTPRGACLGKETRRLPLEPSNPRRPEPVHPECPAGRRGPSPPCTRSEGLRETVRRWRLRAPDHPLAEPSPRPVQSNARGGERGGAPPSPHTAAGGPRPVPLQLPGRL